MKNTVLRGNGDWTAWGWMWRFTDRDKIISETPVACCSGGWTKSSLTRCVNMWNHLPTEVLFPGPFPLYSGFWDKEQEANTPEQLHFMYISKSYNWRYFFLGISTEMSAIQKRMRCSIHWSSQAMYLILHYKKKCLLFLAFFLWWKTWKAGLYKVRFIKKHLIIYCSHSILV